MQLPTPATGCGSRSPPQKPQSLENASLPAVSAVRETLASPASGFVSKVGLRQCVERLPLSEQYSRSNTRVSQWWSVVVSSVRMQTGAVVVIL